MLFDKQNTFHDNVTLAAGANNGDVIDMKGPINLGALRLGLGHGGEGVEVFTKIGTKGNADNTLALTLQGSNSEDMSGAVPIASLAATNLAAGATHHLPIGHHTPYRYFRCIATTAGTTPSINNAKIFLHTTANQRSKAGTGLI